MRCRWLHLIHPDRLSLASPPQWTGPSLAPGSLPPFYSACTDTLRTLGALRRRSTHVLNDTQLDAGIVYTGTGLRMRALVQKLLEGKSIKYGTLLRTAIKLVKHSEWAWLPGVLTDD